MKATDTTPLNELLDRIHDVEPVLRAGAPEAERNRRLPDSVAVALRDAGLYRMFRPRALGGLGANVVAGFQAIEEISRIDSAAGWNIAIANAVEVFGGWFPDAVTEVVFGSSDVVLAGAWNPPRRAVPVDGGYQVSGRCQFSSNCHAATWMLGIAHIYDDDGQSPRLDEDGSTVTLLTLFPMSEARIHENWNTLGMCGTGSHDVEVDVFVPEERAPSLVPPVRPATAYDGPFYRLTIWPAVAAQVPPALGIARAAIDELIGLATGKTPSYTASTLRTRPVAQTQIAQAEAHLGAARAYLYSTLGDMWRNALEGRFPDMKQRALCQLASSHAILAAAEAVDLVHAAAGATAIRNEQRFQRHFRDIHVITQHAFVSASRLEAVGQVLFGLDPEWPFLHLEPLFRDTNEITGRRRIPA